MKLTHQQSELDELFQTYVDYLYQGTTGQIQYPTEQSQAMLDQKICVTYGELLFPSLALLLNSLPLTEHDTFLDMGSGLGKLAIMAFYLGPMPRVRGIEASLALYEQSIKPLAQLKIDCPELFAGLRRLKFEYGNFLEADLSDITVAYCCSTCFSQSLLCEIGHKVNKTPSIRYLLSLRPVPTLTRLKFKKVVELECSWDSALCYVYSQN
jgi:SAM-dependent methyltransferase